MESAFVMMPNSSVAGGRGGGTQTENIIFCHQHIIFIVVKEIIGCEVT